MTDWSGGYVSDIEYDALFNPDLAPRQIALACLVNGCAPPSIKPDFTYCELGCGHGLTLNLLAAIEPAGRFVGIDFNPTHVARAREFAAACGLDNLSFYEASFEELLRDGGSSGMVPFDFMVLHGVYSWVSPANQRAIVELLRRHLKPGGAAYVSYNAMPGWAAGLAMQRLFLELADPRLGRSDKLIEQAIAFADELGRAGAGALRENTFLDNARDRLAKGDIRYLVHEFLNRDWEPLYHADVARAFAEAKLEFVASAFLLANFPHLQLSAEQRRLIEQVPPALRETVKDLCINESFRRDIYLRGARRLSAGERDDRLRTARLALRIPRAEAKLKLRVPAGEADLAPRTYEPVFDALASGPRSVGDLLTLPALPAAGSSATPVELAGILVGTYQAVAAGEPDAAVLDRVRRFNRAVADQVLYGDDVYRKAALASPIAGTGIAYGAIEIVAHAEAIRAPEAGIPQIAESVAARLRAHGRSLLRAGQPAGEDAAAWHGFMVDLERRLAANLPLWRSLRML